MSTLHPSFVGFIGSTKDALMVIQAILDKKLPTVSRRPQHKERHELIRLGHVFVFLEESSGIKRWTDGVPWSASRILGRFLVYRQLDTTTVREKTYKRKNSRTLSMHLPNDTPGLKSFLRHRNTPNEDHTLIKKTLSVSIQGPHSKAQTIHLISYFSAHDVLSGNLIRPSQGGLNQPNILRELTDSVASLTLGGKLPVGDESLYFLDASYQLLDMLVVAMGGTRMDSTGSDPVDHGGIHMLRLGLENLNWTLQDASQNMHYLQPGAGTGPHNVNSPPLQLQPPFEYPPPQLFQQIHQAHPMQVQPPQEAYKLQIPQQGVGLPLPVTYPMHLQVPATMIADMHPHMQQIFAQNNMEDQHGSPYSVSHNNTDASSMSMNGATSSNMQHPQFIHGPSLYPWGVQQQQPAEYFPSEQHPDRESKEYY